ncbi:TIGR03364 family FAD-dependent oxidoreductase [Amycolatopsis taiwanensis]|uniref:TIGR03364 family FAD-dependent oxidoreductase n=1 Tax=Amycolatopsis taiwanensis TaxID=342230 RepID=UPI002553652D|nr:TIGR03364 family FAD-dependent oxidoreductase [Amycolatopsis taiwanensis]
MTSLRWAAETDLVVVGAGIVGLSHAVEAVARGLSVTVVERDERAVGASVRNFGHGCVTAQSGVALEYAMAARARWLRLGKDAGFLVQDAGTLVAARADDELAVLAELRDLRGDDVVLLDRAAVLERVTLGEEVIGGAWLPLDLRVDARSAPAAIAAWLASQGVVFHWGTAVTSTEPGIVHTAHGDLCAKWTVVAVGHDVDRLHPEIAATHGVRRCGLHMLRVRDPHARPVEEAVLTGHAMLRYSAFDACPSRSAVRDRLAAVAPETLDAQLNLMFTQRPDGTLTIGDTHDYATTLPPFRDEARDELIRSETARLLGVSTVDVLERWPGVYASAPEPFLIDTPHSGARVVSVTSGIGMTTAFGLAPAVLDSLLT